MLNLKVIFVGTVINLDDERKKRNKDIIERMKKGESLARYKPQDTWFQPRPIIKKDLTKLYGDQRTDSGDRKQPLRIIKDGEGNDQGGT